jgi:metal-responsive CopG/Arc/MetJ family transcriptional regulator
MASVKVKIDKTLFEKVSAFAKMAGYPSAEEFIGHCLEKEVAKIEEADSEEDIKKKLKGLGYIS